MKQHILFFAGGLKGPNARARGESNGLLERGWYVTKHTSGGTLGPYRTKTEAKRVIGGDGYIEKPKNKIPPELYAIKF
jgi:hypothetical protein